jgi:predicted RNase H-like HicB family nuclease
MEFKPKITKDGKFYLVEIEELDGYTQGFSQEEAELMAQDYLVCMIDAYFDKQVEVKMSKDAQGKLVLTVPDEYAIPLILRQLRAHSHKTIEEVSRACGFKSPNAYAQYEQGRRLPGIGQFIKLLEVFGATMEVKRLQETK